MSLVHLHLLLNHIPVVGILFAVVAFASALAFRETVSTRFALVFTLALAIVTGAAYLTGEPAEEAVENIAGVSESAIEAHEEAAKLATIAMSILGTLSLTALLAFRRGRMPRWVGVAGVAGSLIVSGLLGWTANIGGQIRHSEIRSGSFQETRESVDD
jgi:uncharacterized membrane protein